MSAERRANKRMLVVGRIVAPRGVAGELKVELGDSAPERFVALKRVLLGEALTPHVVRQARVHRGQGLLLLADVASREAAEEWRGALVYAYQQDLAPLEADEYLVSDIIGLQVATEEGEALGEIIEVIVTGANDVYVVRGAQTDLLLPAIKQVILAVDVPTGTMTVRLLDGLR